MNSFQTSLEALSHLTQRVHTGRVLTPQGFADERALLRESPDVAGHALHARLSERALLPVERMDPYGIRFTAFAAPSGTLHCTVTMQAGGHQVRVLMSLADETTLRWLDESIKQQRIIFSFDVVETNQLAIAVLPCPFRDPERLYALLQGHFKPDRKTAIDDGLEVALELLKPATIPSIFVEVAVSDVDLVVALDCLQPNKWRDDAAKRPGPVH